MSVTAASLAGRAASNFEAISSESAERANRPGPMAAIVVPADVAARARAGASMPAISAITCRTVSSVSGQAWTWRIEPARTSDSVTAALPAGADKCATTECRSAMHAAPVLVEEAGIDHLDGPVLAAHRIGGEEFFAVPLASALEQRQRDVALGRRA